MKIYCPKCKAHTEFYEIDDGPDVGDETLTYLSYNCEICYIHLDGKNKNWYNSDEVSCYLHIERATPYMTSEDYDSIKPS